ncbi:MAG: ABC transporter substrate-binding protein [Clostridia bacterium]|nr:ABC transporter substrate-binding protein [Clostridia bacterium]
MKKLLSIAIALCLVLALSACALAEDKTYNVGILQQLQHPALDLATQGFKDALVAKLGDKVVIDEQNGSNDQNACAIIAGNFAAANVDLIMANATTALQEAANATINNPIPVLGTSITNYATALELEVNPDGSTGINVSGTSDLAPLDGQANMIKELFPDAKTVGLLYCSAEPNSVFQADAVDAYLKELGYETTRYTFTDTNDLTSVAQLATVSDVIYIPTDNTAANNTEAIANVVLPAKVPVVAGEEGICSGCGVATLTISYYDIGYETGLMAYEILVEGADVAAMPVRYAPQFTKKYNAANAAELGVEIPADYAPIE